MTNRFVAEFAACVREELRKRQKNIVGHKGRFPKRQLFLAFNKTKKLFHSEFGCAVTSRWSAVKRRTGRDTLVLEYLLDYGICRYSIPQAIRQLKRELPQLAANERYEILLGVESELGTDDEVARDLLKLLDVKCRARCLVFQKRIRHPDRLLDRLRWTLRHHAHYDSAEPLLLIAIPLVKTPAFADEIEFVLVRNGFVTTFFQPTPRRTLYRL